MPPRLLLDSPLEIEQITDRLRLEGAISLPALEEPGRELLMRAARAARYRPGKSVVGSPPNEVRQRLEVASDFAPDSVFRALTRAWQQAWDQALARTAHSPFTGILHFNDLMLQRYAPCEVGISAHRDRSAYRNLICLFVLEGAGRFCLCDDRSGRGLREIPTRPGEVILTRAPGFLGSDERPFHLVREVTATRYVFGLRQLAHG